ncbi:MAG TPA: hypothetical protein VN688_08780 [Gemmataceae bacterium]|nr:hypothetical protein [Gemmataceae bacterium]
MNRMTRWMKHWQTLPPRNRAGAALCLAALIACIIALAYQIGGLVADIPTPVRTPDPAAVHGRVWNKTQPLLEQADRQAAQALDKHLASIHAFLDERQAGSRAFAEQMLSLRGKWELVKAEIGDNSDYAAFLQEAFDQHVFPMEDLEKAVDTAVRSYLAELESIDDDLLVRLRADLADDELPRLVIPALRSDQALRSHYHELSQRVAHDLRTDLTVVVARELFLWQASNVATDLTLKAGAAIAARLGVSSTILAAGAASTWRTLGVGLVVAIVLDAVVNRIIKAAGYDAEEQIAGRVEETLIALGRTITDGDPEARATLEKLKTMQREDPDAEVRAECAESIRSIEAGTQLYGLRRELSTISAARASLRKETLRRLIHESE